MILRSYGSTREWIDSKLMTNDGEDCIPQPANSASGSGILWWLNRDAESDGGANSDLAFYLNGPMVCLNYVSDDARARPVPIGLVLTASSVNSFLRIFSGMPDPVSAHSITICAA